MNVTIIHENMYIIRERERERERWIESARKLYM